MSLKAHLLESTFTDEAFVAMLRSSGPANVVSVVVGLSDLLFLFVPDLHTVVEDENVDGSTLSLVAETGQSWTQRAVSRALT